MYATLEYLYALYRRRVRNSHARRAEWEASCSKPMEATLDHVAYSAHNPLLLLKFYRDVLNLAPIHEKEFRAGTKPFPSVRLNSNSIIDFIPRTPDDNTTPSGHICMCVTKEAFDKLIVRLAKYGVHTEAPRLLSGARGNGWAVYIEDPELNTVEFRWY